MEVQITIHTRYYENYETEEGTPKWKAKGMHRFTLDADQYDVMYTRDLDGILSDMVADRSNSYEKFEYLRHDVDFSEPTRLSKEDFVSRLNEQLKNG